MSRSRRTTVVIALVLALVAGGAPAVQAAALSEPEASVSAKKKKPKKCKQGRVRERIQKKTRCVSARKAWPKPKAIDMRKAAASYVLNTSFSKLRDRRGKRLPSLPKLLRKVVTLTNNGHISVTGQGPGQTAPYEYTGSAAGIGPNDASMMVTLSSCPDPMYNGQQFTIGLPFAAFDTVGAKTSADGLDYTGASSRSSGALTQEWHWTMHGTPP